MGRNSHFQSGRKPLQDHPDLQLRPSHVSGPIPFLNPTWAWYTPHSRDHPTQLSDKPKHVQHVWRSRDNRKGRHALRVDYGIAPEDSECLPPHPTSTWQVALRGLFEWEPTLPIGMSLTLLPSYLRLDRLCGLPDTEFADESLTGGGVTALIGATIFEIGSVLLLLEAVNENQTGCFGWALKEELKRADSHTSRDVVVTRVKPTMEKCQHHQATKKNLLDIWPKRSHELRLHLLSHFRWLPSWAEIKSHYIHELGFLASLVQFIAATIFWIAGFTALPGINNYLSQGLADGVYWTPQIVGGIGFVISGLLFALETQKAWYKPALNVLGWHIGVWNFIGGIGFTLCGALGPAASDSSVEYQATLATFWGSWAFMIGSTIQWFESLQKHPVEKVGKPSSTTGIK
ncbi:hypothetical protein N7450_006568 [Penicillium hetheringtonii]|uniref:Integral membrane protein n=1 Tax=Penicillium hetheringtonii TaxID=911720 RepID=A0AAD6GS87_9EURO|nr:hypothetical protein N7450_006568 [Penicillium hetheringtonii]